jgi:hypothetical protein
VRREEKTVTDTGQALSRPRTPDYTPRSGVWTGWVMFAGTMMIMVGAFHALAGFVALFEDDYFVTTSSGLLISVDYTPWGWAHLAIGALVAGAGVAVFFGQVWARVIGVVLAALSALANMVFIAAYPLWSIVIIALDVVVIYALVVHGRDVKVDA